MALVSIKIPPVDVTFEERKLITSLNQDTSVIILLLDGRRRTVVPNQSAQPSRIGTLISDDITRQRSSTVRLVIDGIRLITYHHSWGDSHRRKLVSNL